jgi:hypothetical protein
MESPYRLFIQKEVDFSQNNKVLAIRFSVLNGNFNYPHDFVCILTKTKEYILNPHNQNSFAAIFKDVNRIAFALQLLNDALINSQYANDPDIKAEIEARIKILQKPQNSPKNCLKCGSQFVPKYKKANYCSSCQESYRKKFNEPKPPRPLKKKAYWISKSVREAFQNGAFNND